MKKPMHWLTCLIVVAAALYPITEIFRLMTAHPPNVLSYWLAVRGVVLVTIQFAALAVVIEIADQIRWRGLSPEEKSRLSERSALDRRLTS